jgi:hypothetical protein
MVPRALFPTFLSPPSRISDYPPPPQPRRRGDTFITGSTGRCNCWNRAVSEMMDDFIPSLNHSNVFRFTHRGSVRRDARMSSDLR